MIIINSIEINNFLCYYGSNLLRFSRGANIILGQNNTGKSKLFDAFNWVLHDVVFDSSMSDGGKMSKMWEPTQNLRERLVNNRAKMECEEGRSVRAFVEIHFTRRQEDKGPEWEYIIRRAYSIEKIDDTWEYSSSWETSKYAELTLSRTNTDSARQETITITNYNDVRQEIEGVLPIELLRYSLLQGENLSSLIALNKRSEFSNAFAEIAKTRLFDSARREANSLLKELLAQLPNDKNVQKEVKRIEDNITQLEKELEAYERERENYQSEKKRIYDLIDQANDELAKVEDFRSVMSQIKELQKTLKEIQQEKYSHWEDQRDAAIELWMYRGTETKVQQFLHLYESYKSEKKIPERIRQDFIQQMLDEHICLVCGRKAEPESPHFHQISSYRTSSSLEPVVENIYNLSFSGTDFLRNLSEVPNQLRSFYRELEELEDRATLTKEKIEGQKLELSRLAREKEEETGEKVTTEDLEKIDYPKLVSDKGRYETEIYKLEKNINHTSGVIDAKTEELEKEKKNLNNELQKQADSEKKYQVLLGKRVHNLLSELYEAIRKDLIKEVGGHSQHYFSRMTAQNMSLSGKIVVDASNEEAYLADENGRRRDLPNSADRVAFQISFVAAILKVAYTYFPNSTFPFISDAPVSAMGGNNKLEAIKSMIDNFGQSIIILKDDLSESERLQGKEDLVRTFIQYNDKVKNAYELSMNGETVAGQTTHIKILKS